MAWAKLEGPVTCLTFLGFELDSLRNEIRIPKQKMQDVKKEVDRWFHKKSCQRKELESIVGRLCHTSRVVQPGKTFMCHLFEALAGLDELTTQVPPFVPTFYSGTPSCLSKTA